MASDALATLGSESGASITAGTTSYTAFDLLTGTPRRGMWAEITVTANGAAGGTPTQYFTITHCATSGGTYDLLASGIDQVVTTGTTAPYVVYIPVNTDRRYIKLNQVVTGAGTITSSFTARLVTAKNHITA